VWNPEASASPGDHREEKPIHRPQIVAILKQHEAGKATKDVCREHGISQTTFYKWKAKFGGMEVSNVAKMRALEDENRRLNAS
jgi:transposase-like protein